MRGKLPGGEGEKLGSRDRLIAGAVAVVARDGLEKASVKAIAAEAKIGPGLLHYHFASKEAVLEAALMQASERHAARLRDLRENTPPGRMIPAFIALAGDAIGDDIELFKVRIAFAARAMADPALASRFRATNAASLEETACLFAADRGAAKPTGDDRARAQVVKACYDGIMLSLMMDAEFPVATARTLFSRALAVDER